MKSILLRLGWCALAAFLTFGCDKDEDSGKIYNAMFNVVDNLRTPTMIANAEGLKTWVLPGDKLKLKAVPAPDSSGVTYEWTFSEGSPATSSSKNVTWQAPTAQGTVTVRLKCKKAGEYFYDEGFTVHVVKLSLTEVSFSGVAADEYCEVQSDPPGSIGYSAPHWTPGASKPVCYVHKKKMRLESKVNVDPAAALTGATIKIKGDGPGNLDIATDDSASAAAGVVTSKIKPTDGELPDSVKFYDKLAIQWGISLDDGKRWFTPPALKSENRVYVTLAKPTPTLYETLLYVSCKAADGDSTPNSTFKDIWGKVKSLKVKKEDGTPLTYYADWACGNLNTAALIANGDGQCGAWAHFVIDGLACHGIVSSWVNLQPNAAVLPAPLSGPPWLLVKKWKFNTISGNPSGNAEYRWRYRNWEQTAATHPSDIVDKNGVKGQENANPLAEFNRHFIVKYGGKFYDPSYGQGPFNDVSAWEKNGIAGYGAIVKFNAPPGWPWVPVTIDAFELGARKDVGSMDEMEEY